MILLGKADHQRGSGTGSLIASHIKFKLWQAAQSKNSMRKKRPFPVTEQSIQQHLEKALTAHTEWVKSDGQDGAALDLSGEEMRGVLLLANLHRAKLDSANLDNATLTCVDPGSEDLTDAELAEAYRIEAALLDILLNNPDR